MLYNVFLEKKIVTMASKVLLYQIATMSKHFRYYQNPLLYTLAIWLLSRIVIIWSALSIRTFLQDLVEMQFCVIRKAS